MPSIIARPQLKPRAGYVEVEVDGVRRYQKIVTEQDRQIAVLEQANADKDALIAAQQEQIQMIDGALTDFLIHTVPSLGTGV